MIRRPRSEIFVVYNEREVRELWEGENFIIRPDGAGLSCLYMFLMAEGSMDIKQDLEQSIYREYLEDGYMVLKLSGSIEEIQTILTEVVFVFPENE